LLVIGLEKQHLYARRVPSLFMPCSKVRVKLPIVVKSQILCYFSHNF